MGLGFHVALEKGLPKPMKSLLLGKCWKWRIYIPHTVAHHWWQSTITLWSCLCDTKGTSPVQWISQRASSFPLLPDEGWRREGYISCAVILHWFDLKWISTTFSQDQASKNESVTATWPFPSSPFAESSLRCPWAWSCWSLCQKTISLSTPWYN